MVFGGHCWNVAIIGTKLAIDIVIERHVNLRTRMSVMTASKIFVNDFGGNLFVSK